MLPVVVSGAPRQDGDDIAMAITGVTQDEPVESFFGLDITPDAQLGTRPGELLLRAERPWSGDGGHVCIASGFTATDVHGAGCSPRRHRPACPQLAPSATRLGRELQLTRARGRH